MNEYNAGLLNDWGGGNVDWWHDYLRYEVANANSHWIEQVENLRAERDAAELMSLALNAELAELRKPDCFRCAYWFACRTLIKDDCGGGDKFVPKRDPVRLYEKEGKV